jgi:NADPH-dependent 2,4-dienoyl-CoA reductase/sulfur reductase-like enzyme
MPERIVIIGGGVAGFAAAEKLRREQYQGSIVMLSNDDAPPVDRPNLSKDYLAGKAPEEWVPRRRVSFYSDNDIDMRLGASVTGIDTRSHEVALSEGSKVRYDRLLLATGAEPARLSIPGAEQAHVHTLRSFADCRAIIESAKAASLGLRSLPRSEPVTSRSMWWRRKSDPWSEDRRFCARPARGAWRSLPP